MSDAHPVSKRRTALKSTLIGAAASLFFVLAPGQVSASSRHPAEPADASGVVAVGPALYLEGKPWQFTGSTSPKRPATMRSMVAAAPRSTCRRFLVPYPATAWSG